MPSRRTVLKSALLSAGAALVTFDCLYALASEDAPPYNLDGFQEYADYKRNRKLNGLAPDSVKPDPDNPSLQRDGRRCMNCGRCDAACMEQKIAHWYKPEDLKSSVKTLCMHCGQCVSACKYNVLTEKLGKTNCYGSKAELLLRAVLGLAEVRAEDNLAAVSN